MTGVSVLGPWPGTKVLEAQRTAVDELARAPHGVEPLPPTVQLPSRGPWAESVARTAALLPEMPVELGPHGWKLADRPGADQRRTEALLREDLDALAVAAHGWTGRLVVSVRGPWSLAAILYLARGDRVLADAGAVRDVVAALAEGLGPLLASVRASVPGAEPVVVLREPMLPDVLGGTVATFSGHGRLAAVEGELVAQGLTSVVDGARAAGAVEVVAHGGLRFASRALTALAASGADAVGLGADAVRGPQWEQVAAVVEAGRRMWFGLPPERNGRRTDVAKVARGIARPWTAVGLPARDLADVAVHVEASPTLTGGDLVINDLRALRPAIASAVRVAAELAETADAG
ncbi:hypothetical protein GXB85_06845 [Cellulomonas sp. APG4]|uniref:hypothetical protein n=1 Tax=Cellulomonas sp. APG4 TaxID=1538656 RepID=UPI0013798FB0|nr:hypothetical protein [Cellulomonas sp. APG4]NCT90661.1 hypothetical protein [Cellulomonas sp. APG4]